MGRGKPEGSEPTHAAWLALVLAVAGLVLLLVGVVLISGFAIDP
jgi:hypothetical protein